MIGETEARPDVRVVVRIEAALAGATRSDAREDQRTRTAASRRIRRTDVDVRVAVSARDVPTDRHFVTEAKIQGEALGNTPVVLEIERGVVIDGGIEQYRGHNVRGHVDGAQQEAGEFMAAGGERRRQRRLGTVEDITPVSAGQISAKGGVTTPIAAELDFMLALEQGVALA